MVSSNDNNTNSDFDWDTDEEVLPSHDLVPTLSKEVPEAGPSQANYISKFVAMGFPMESVQKAINRNGEGNMEDILETLLTYGAIDGSSSIHVESSRCSPLASDKDVSDDDFYMENYFEDIGNEYYAEKDRIVSTLVDMGFHAEEASAAIDRCGTNASFLELADSIRAAQMQDDSDDLVWKESPASNSDADKDEEHSSHILSTRKKQVPELRRKNKNRMYIPTQRQTLNKLKPANADETDTLSIPQPMIGFSIPFEPARITSRKLPEGSLPLPYFYYENVALTPKGVWETISRFLYDVEPEFVDSKYFCAAARKRGYVHNLPIKDRFPLTPIPPKTIQEAFPQTKKWWPAWDKRTHLNCIQTCHASSKNTDRIRQALMDSDDPPPISVQNWIMHECRKWNLVWIGPNKVAPLEPDEIEMLLGFPRNHTRGSSRTERYRSLGNSFQVDTVAYHLSVLKDLFPNGIRVLSLFSGIGGSEVALHRLGIRLKLVVSVEVSESSRNVMRNWWDETNQTGKLIHISDIQEVDEDQLQCFIRNYGAFDLVIGGSPCNNLAGSNRHHRDGLEGEHSALFFEYTRILNHVRCMMDQN